MRHFREYPDNFKLLCQWLELIGMEQPTGMEPTGASLDKVGEQRSVVVGTVQPRDLVFHRWKDAGKASVIFLWKKHLFNF